MRNFEKTSKKAKFINEAALELKEKQMQRRKDRKNRRVEQEIAWV